jgi:membrane protein implicated in regulation of membrane protease activity
MLVAMPRRFSRDWWLTLIVVTVAVSAVVFFLLRDRGLGAGEVVLYCLAFSLLGDVVTAVSMEAVAPTRLMIGPGDRRLNDDLPSELALVVSEFDDAGVGQVRIRGETWRAKSTDSEFRPARGSRVRVVNRDGLTLIVLGDVG